MTWQRTIGIDLGLEGKHAAIACDERGKTLNAKAFKFTTDLQEMEKLITKFIPEGIDKKRVAITMESTSNAWLSVSALFISKGYSVFIIKAQKSYDLRKFFKKHAKTDPIDAQSLARMPFVDPEGLNQLVLPDKDYFSLQKLLKFRENIVKDVSAYKNRIYSRFQILNPKLMALLGDDRFTYMGKAFYKKYANPFKVKKDGFKKFKIYLNKKAFGTPNQDVIQKMYDVSINIVELHQGIITNDKNNQLPYDMDQLQDIIKKELRIMDFLEKECLKIERDIKNLYDKIDPQKVLKDIKGFGSNIIAPAIIAFTGSVKRFGCVRNYLGYVGLVPRTKQSCKPAKEGLKITKAGQGLLKKYYCLAAETARHFDVELAHKYKMLMASGRHHNQAICALANMLARRVYSLLKRKEEALENDDEVKLKSIQYELRNLNHYRITEKEAREICLRDYPTKREQARRLKEKKEKAATAFISGQSPSREKSHKGNSTLSSVVQPSPITMKDHIVAQLLQSVQLSIENGNLDQKNARVIKELISFSC